MGMTLAATYQWQYNGIAPWKTIINWCFDHIPDSYNKSETIYFSSAEDYTLFLLRWAD
jgi:hypothetical protein